MANPFDCGKLGVTQTVVNVRAAQRTHQGTGKKQFFQRAVRTDQRAYAGRTVLLLDPVQALGNIGQSRLPVDGNPGIALLEHGAGQALIAA